MAISKLILVGIIFIIFAAVFLPIAEALNCLICLYSPDGATATKFQNLGQLGINDEDCKNNPKNYSFGIESGESYACVTVNGTMKSGAAFMFRAITKGPREFKCYTNLKLLKVDLLDSHDNLCKEIKAAGICFCPTDRCNKPGQPQDYYVKPVQPPRNTTVKTTRKPKTKNKNRNNNNNSAVTLTSFPFILPLIAATLSSVRQSF